MKLKKQKPSSLYDDTNPDWTPSLHLGYDVAVPDEARYIIDCSKGILGE